MIERAGRWIFATIFVVSGILHFAIPETYARIVPPMFPRPRLLVLISGGAEILGGVGLLIPRTRRPAAFGLAVLLIAVFPANIYMATNPVEANATSIPRVLLWGRLPLQVVLMGWLLWCTRPRSRGPLIVLPAP